jgi:hypothetical protein
MQTFRRSPCVRFPTLFRSDWGIGPISLGSSQTGQKERAEDADDLSDDFSIDVIAKLFRADESSSVMVECDELVFDCATAQRV